MLCLLLRILIQCFQQPIFTADTKFFLQALQGPFQNLNNFVKSPGMFFASRLQSVLKKANQQLLSGRLCTYSNLSHKRWPSLFDIIISSGCVCSSPSLQINALYLSSISFPQWNSMQFAYNSVNQPWKKTNKQTNLVRNELTCILKNQIKNRWSVLVVVGFYN